MKLILETAILMAFFSITTHAKLVKILDFPFTKFKTEGEYVSPDCEIIFLDPTEDISFDDFPKDKYYEKLYMMGGDTIVSRQWRSYHWVYIQASPEVQEDLRMGRPVEWDKNSKNNHMDISTTYPDKTSIMITATIKKEEEKKHRKNKRDHQVQAKLVLERSSLEPIKLSSIYQEWGSLFRIGRKVRQVCD